MRAKVVRQHIASANVMCVNRELAQRKNTKLGEYVERDEKRGMGKALTWPLPADGRGKVNRRAANQQPEVIRIKICIMYRAQHTQHTYQLYVYIRKICMMNNSKG